MGGAYQAGICQERYRSNYKNHGDLAFTAAPLLVKHAVDSSAEQFLDVGLTVCTEWYSIGCLL